MRLPSGDADGASVPGHTLDFGGDGVVVVVVVCGAIHAGTFHFVRPLGTPDAAKGAPEPEPVTIAFSASCWPRLSASGTPSLASAIFGAACTNQRR
jgi:hypothetical protein